MSQKAVTVALALILLCAPVWAEIELGLGLAPSLIDTEGRPEEENVLGDFSLSLHAGYSLMWLLYASADSLILPPSLVQSFTSKLDENGFVREGIYRPGMLNLFNVGIRPSFGPVAVMATAGINQLYIYKQDELPDDYEAPTLGVNLRLGAYLFITKNLALTATGTSVFAGFDALISFFKAVAGTDAYLRKQSIEYLMNNLYPTIGLTLTF